MRKLNSKTLILAGLGLGLLALFVVQQGLKQSRYQAASKSLTDLQNIEQLQAQFNRDQGSPRLILLVSPT